MLSLSILSILFVLSFAIANIYQYLICAITRPISSFLCQGYTSFSPPVFTSIMNKRNAIKIPTTCSIRNNNDEGANSFNYILVVAICIYIAYVLNYYILLPVSAMDSVKAIISSFPSEWLFNNPIIWYYDLYIIAALHASITSGHSQHTRHSLMLVSYLSAGIMWVTVKARYFIAYQYFSENPYAKQYDLTLDSREYWVLYINEYYILLLSWVILSYIASNYILYAYYRPNANNVNWVIIFMCTTYAGVIIHWANAAAEARWFGKVNGLDGMVALWVTLLLIKSRSDYQASTIIAIICALITRIAINVIDKESVIMHYVMGGAFAILVIMYIYQWQCWNRQNLISTHFTFQTQQNVAT